MHAGLGGVSITEERKPRRVAINVGQHAPVIEGSESSTA
jgi:hypothetical protein